MNKDKLDQLREKFFKECTNNTGMRLVDDNRPILEFNGQHEDPVDMWNWIVTNLLQGEAPPASSGNDIEPLTHKILESLGFEGLSHYTVHSAMIKDIGRDRILSIGCVGTPNEMLSIQEMKGKKVEEMVVLHNYDYDGRLSLRKLQAIISLLSSNTASPQINDSSIEP